VAHVGDSTSVGMISAAVLPDPAQRLAARYARVGVAHLLVDASGGRSIEEVLPGQVNGFNVARGWVSHGYRGCWVFALGTNDTANVSVGSDLSRMARIERMMSAAHGEPVLWVNTRTLLTAGPWSEANMLTWNATLRAACARYPNMRVFDWASVAEPGWYLSDGIHYTPAGYAVRAHAIATALARAFGPGGASRGCLVR
jgi:lysophospholipase L1-like esterase